MWVQSPLLIAREIMERSIYQPQQALKACVISIFILGSATLSFLGAETVRKTTELQGFTNYVSNSLASTNDVVSLESLQNALTATCNGSLRLRALSSSTGGITGSIMAESFMSTVTWLKSPHGAIRRPFSILWKRSRLSSSAVFRLSTLSRSNIP